LYFRDSSARIGSATHEGHTAWSKRGTGALLGSERSLRLEPFWRETAWLIAAITITATAGISSCPGGQSGELGTAERLISEPAAAGRQHVHGVGRERIAGGCGSELRAAKCVGARCKPTETAIACCLRQTCRVRRSSKPCRCSKAASTRTEATVTSSGARGRLLLSRRLLLSDLWIATRA
jgi:hypothetical protein